jgi:membrane fusion protein, multidrug efflux system
MSPLRQRLVTAALAPLAALGLAACDSSEATRVAPDPAPTPIAVATATVEQRAVPTTLEVTGTLTADARTDAAAEIDGRVVQVSVERGMVVAAGAVLARLDEQDAVNQLREAEATEAQTRARLGIGESGAFDPRETPEARRMRAVMDRAEADYQRYARLVEQGIVSRSEFDTRRADAIAAREQYEEMQNQMRQLYQTLQAQKARVALARKALADTVVRAPYGGLVAEKHVNVGDYVKKGSRVATVMRVDPLRIELTIPEVAVASVRKGQKVSFTVQSYPDRAFEGAIAYVGPALRADARSLIVEAIVPNAGGGLQPGLFASARIELPGAKPTPVVPAAAIRTEAGASRLFVVKGDRAEQRFVQLGRQGAGLVEVVRGVAAGEHVAVSALDRLTDGALVAPAPEGR